MLFYAMLRSVGLYCIFMLMFTHTIQLMHTHAGLTSGPCLQNRNGANIPSLSFNDSKVFTAAYTEGSLNNMY